MPKQFGNVKPGGFQGPAGGGGFDGGAMAMMYQNMMKNNGMGGECDSGFVSVYLLMLGMGGMGGGFDPTAMTMMYQNMLKSEPTTARYVNDELMYSNVNG